MPHVVFEHPLDPRFLEWWRLSSERVVRWVELCAIAWERAGHR